MSNNNIPNYVYLANRARELKETFNPRMLYGFMYKDPNKLSANYFDSDALDYLDIDHRSLTPEQCQTELTKKLSDARKILGLEMFTLNVKCQKYCASRNQHCTVGALSEIVYNNMKTQMEKEIVLSK